MGRCRAQGRPDDDLHGLARALSASRPGRVCRRGGARLDDRAQQRAGGPANGTQIGIGGGGGAEAPLSPFDAGIAPIVDGMVSQPCNGRLLVPYAQSPASSP